MIYSRNLKNRKTTTIIDEESCVDPVGMHHGSRQQPPVIPANLLSTNLLPPFPMQTSLITDFFSRPTAKREREEDIETDADAVAPAASSATPDVASAVTSAPASSSAAADIKRPDIPEYSAILARLESPLQLIAPEHGTMTWRELDSKVVKDACLPKGGVVTRTIRRWKSAPRPCDNVASHEVWEFSDMPGFFFPPLAGNGCYVKNKDRVAGGLYRYYVGKNGNPKCATKLPTNRFGKHTVPKESKAKTVRNGVTSPSCSLCLVIFGKVDANQAQYPLLGIDNAVCGGCQGAVGAVRTLQSPCHGDSCDKEAAYPENKDGSGKTNFYCAGCSKKKHGVAPPSQNPAKCNCDLKRNFNDCGICCLTAVPPRPVRKWTCINLIDGGDGESKICNTQFRTKHKQLCESLLPDLDRPLCPSCMYSSLGYTAVLKKREDEWRPATKVELQERTGDEYAEPETEVTFGSAAQNSACLASAHGGDESRWRRVDSVLSLMTFAVVNELDQVGHSESSYKCDHNSVWDQHVFDCFRQLRGPSYDLYVIRVNPDGKGEDGKRISAASDRGVAVSARTSAEATIKALAHGKARAQRREKGESLPGKCFISHYYYADDSIQLGNEKSLCENRAEFELLRFS